MSRVTTRPVLEPAAFPMLLDDIPVIYEDEEDDMGESNRHTRSCVNLYPCLEAFLESRRPELQVFANMNCYYLKGPRYPKTRSKPYFSADIMIVAPPEPLPADIVSYTIGKHGPAPLLALEVLSPKTAVKRDLKAKTQIYAKLGVQEYLQVDPTGKYLRKKLLLKRLRPNRKWQDVQDADGGVTSLLGFRLVLDVMDDVVVLDAESGRPFVRPFEAQAERQIRLLAEERMQVAEERMREAIQKRADAEEQLRQLQAEFDRLRREKS